MRTPLTRLSCKRATSEQCFPPFWTGRRVWMVDEYRRAGPGSSLGSCPFYLSHIPGLWVSINTRSLWSPKASCL